MTTNASLIGFWRLLSARREDTETGEVQDLYGPDPSGFLLLAPGGRMMAIITGNGRTGKDPAALFGSMMAYSGTYQVDGDRWITDVDVAWHPDWLGTKQERFFRIEGDELHIRTAPTQHPAFGRTARGILRWRREELI